MYISTIKRNTTVREMVYNHSLVFTSVWSNATCGIHVLSFQSSISYKYEYTNIYSTHHVCCREFQPMKETY